MKLKNLALSVLVACSSLATTAWADITLNPAANNGGAGTLDAGTMAFTTNNSQIAFTSLLDINSTPGAMGPVAFSESGNFQILNFNPQPSGTSNVTNTYNVYATFKVTGAGIWATPNLFVVTTFAGLNASVYGSPGCTTSGVNGGSCGASSGLTFSDPTSSNAATFAQYGITQGASDFLLGTSFLINDPTNSASVSVGAGTSGAATESILALLGFTAAPGTAGVNGFWQLPDPFSINIGSQAGGNTVQTSFTVSGGITSVAVDNLNGINTGGGSLAYTTVPEPASLALLGIGLLGMGAAARRRKS
jgi:hypothetical protein